MAENIKRHISHLKSSGGTAPAATALTFGEIAVGYKANSEALYIKNNSGSVVTFNTSAAILAAAEIYTDTHALSSTTKYASSSSQGGAATSAEKLTNTSAIGSGTQPVFFTANGVPSATTYSLSKSVPSNAVFTDTATTLDGHFTPTAVTGGTKSANASSTSDLSWGSAVVTGVTLSGDAKGHITAVAVASGKLKTPSKTDVGLGNVENKSSATIRSEITKDNVTTALGYTPVSSVTSSSTNGSISVNGSNVVAYTHPTTSGNKHIPSGGASGQFLKWSADGTATWANDNNTAQLQVSDTTNNKINTKQSTGNYIQFSGGTNAFKVTDGTSAFTVSITPSITNNVTGSSLTEGDIIIGGGGSKISASTIQITTTAPSSSSDDTKVPTSKAVWSAVSNGIAANDAMVYKGTIDGGSTGAYGALTQAANKGWTYKVTTAGKIDGVAVEVGDMLICNTDNTAAATSSNYSEIAAKWDFIQTNIDGAVIGPTSSTDGHVAVFDGTTGKLIKDGTYTIAKSVPSNAVFTDTATTLNGHFTPTAVTGGTKSANASSSTAAAWGDAIVTGVTLSGDAKGHITAIAVASKNLPSNPIPSISGSSTGATNKTVTAMSQSNGVVTLTYDSISITKSQVSDFGSYLTATTKYAASSSVGGSASSAEKLTNTSAIGSSTQPVFFTANGVPSATTYSLSKSVPSSAVFTDENVKQSATTANGSYELLLAGTTATTTETKGANKNVGLTYNPSTSALTVGNKEITATKITNWDNAQANQNAYSNIKIGSTTLAAASTTDTVEFAVTNTTGTDGLTISGTNGAAGADKVTINLGDIECGDYA